MTRFSVLMKKSDKQYTKFVDNVICNNSECFAKVDGKKIKMADIFDGTYQVYQNRVIIYESELTAEGLKLLGGDLETDGTKTSHIEFQTLSS